MGCFDTVFVPCPKCGTMTEAQSKYGDCLMRCFSMEEAPADVMSGVSDDGPFECVKCGTEYNVVIDHYDAVAELHRVPVYRSAPTAELGSLMPMPKSTAKEMNGIKFEGFTFDVFIDAKGRLAFTVYDPNKDRAVDLFIDFDQEKVIWA